MLTIVGGRDVTRILSAIDGADPQIAQPVIFQNDGRNFEGVVPEGESHLAVTLRDGVRYAVNPGSVGQPRDGDARAAFAIYTPDSLTLELRRVDYAIDAAQRRIIVAGLPASLANRLAVGR